MKKTLTTLLFLSLLLSTQAFAKFVYTKDGFFSKGNKYAISGYDTVSYFTEHKSKKGNKNYLVKYRNETWLFSSLENQKLFEKDPKKYAPQYGGHCAWAEAQNGDEVYGDPTIWTIVKGKLYLNYNEEINDKWLKQIPNFIKEADRFWLKEFKSLN